MQRTTPRARPGSPDVKAAVLASARRMFAENGFASTGIREIAADAGVNPAIVIRHFGSKEELFIMTIALPDSWIQVMNGPTEQLGAQLVRFIVESSRSKAGRGAYAALTRASDRPGIRASLQATLESSFVDPIVANLKRPDAEARAHLFAAQLTGLMSALWVTEDSYVLGMDTEEIVRIYGSALQSILTGE